MEGIRRRPAGPGRQRGLTRVDSAAEGPDATGGSQSDHTPGAGLSPAVAQILGADGTVAGAGFLVAKDILVTCAHVVTGAGSGPAGAYGWSSRRRPARPGWRDRSSRSRGGLRRTRTWPSSA